MGKGMGDPAAIKDLKDVTAKLGCLIFYLLYLAFGILLMITGMLYTTEIQDSHSNVTVGLAVSGGILFVIGAVALIAIKQVQWLLLSWVQIANFGLFVFILIGAVGVSMHLPLVGSSSSSPGTAEKAASFFEPRSPVLLMVKRLERVLTDDAEAGAVFTPFTGCTECAATNGGVTGDRRPLLGVLAPDGLLSVWSFWAELGLLLAAGLLPVGLYGLFLALAPLRAPPPGFRPWAPAAMHCWRIIPCSATW